MFNVEMLFFIISILLVSHAVICNSSLSSFYVDNGFDQTVMQKFLTIEDKWNVEQEILNLLGLPEKPKNKNVLKKKLIESSAPQFLLDIYKSLLDTPSRVRRSEFNFSDRDFHAIEESDTIITFAAHNKHISNVRHKKGKRLWFDVSEVPSDETIVDAEMRIFKTSNTKIQSLDGQKPYTITVFMLLNNDMNQRELKYIDSVNTTLDYEGWLLFNMTEPLSTWVATPYSNKGLYLSIHSTLSSDRELKPEDIGIINTSRTKSIKSSGDNYLLEKEPFMVAFLRASDDRPRVRRQTSTRRKKKNSRSEISHHRNPLSDELAWAQARSCQIQSLYVSFKDLEWQDWIIAPEGYAAFYCAGECNFPLNAHMNATNHAIVQTLVHLMNPLEVPKPCCAPTKLSPISVLFFLDDSNVILKKYRNMVVKSCGCH